MKNAIQGYIFDLNGIHKIIKLVHLISVILPNTC